MSCDITQTSCRQWTKRERLGTRLKTAHILRHYHWCPREMTSLSLETSGSVAKCRLFSRALDWELLYIIYGSLLDHCIVRPSLRSKCLEVVGERENGRVRGRHARGVSPSRAPVFSCAHYFQAPATQAKSDLFDMLPYLKKLFN